MDRDPAPSGHFPLRLLSGLLALAVVLLAWDFILPRLVDHPARIGLYQAMRDLTLLVVAGALLWRRYARRSSERSLRQARERRLALMAQAASDWIWETDRQHRFTYLSDRFYQITGIAPQRVLGQTRWEFAGEQDDPGVWGRHRAVLDSHQPFRDFVYRSRIAGDSGGGDRYLRISGHPVFDASDRFTGYAGLGTDITGEVTAQMRLAESERLLATLLANLPGMIYRGVPGARRGMLYVSGGCRALTGYGPEDLADTGGELSYADLIVESDRGRVLQELARAVERRESYRLQYRIRTCDGQRKWVWEQGAPVYDGQGQAVGMEGLITDISEQKATEAEMKRIRLYLKNVIDSMPSLLLGIDPEGRLMDWNQHAARISGMTWQQARGRPFEQVFPQLEGRRPMVMQALRERRTLKPQRYKVALDGITHHLEVMAYPLVADNTLGAVIRVDDVTARVRIEEMMVQTEKMLSVGGLAAGMAHEINNPLGAIMQGAQNIQRRLDPGAPRNRRLAEELGLDLGVMHSYLERRGILRFLTGLREAGARAARIVADMLSFSRRTGKREFRPADPHEMLDTALRLAASDYELRSRYDFRRIRVAREYDPGLRAVVCDRTEIEQVLLNLIKNAAQAMLAADVPDPVLTLRCRRELRYACLEVIDNGPGMEESVRRRIFEPFFTTKEVGLGTGLGLSVSYFIVTEQHRGSLTVSSAPGRGARFTVLLPLEEE